MITPDALHTQHTQHTHASYLHQRGAHYLAVAKKNHLGLHGKVRRLKTAAFAHLDYPHACQALQVVRRRRDLATGRLTIKRIYLVTSLPPAGATGAELAAWNREHWHIENHSTTSGTAPSTKTPRRSGPGTCPASWPACATSPSASTTRTATPTSPPHSAAPDGTTSGPSPPSG
ncbi:hypothetical protein ACIRJR_36760 [Streptomyces sp. NPDC102402]|uniref:hypothetical protein n=1 Tax=Streptomyces sp. NPDC102402 TaxID=3366169 RepID=UPI003816D349